MKHAIEIKDFGFTYFGSEKAAVKNCNLHVNHGEFVLLSGPSGEGKSTLLWGINGVIPNLVNGEIEGTVLIEGESIEGKKTSQISKVVGSVLQNADSQIVHSHVGDEIAFGCENLCIEPKEIQNRINRACEMMELNPSWQTKTLSGGQKQRLITATTLAMGQKILVFDEPLANLDTKGANLLLRRLQQLAKEGYAILLVEHRVDVALSFVDRVYWMKDGKPIEVQEYSQIQADNEHFIPDATINKVQSKPYIEAKHLQFSVGGRDILRDINFTVYKGERVLILGENGCGKTTLLRILCGLLEPTGGSLIGESGNLLRQKQKQRLKQVGYIYQNPNYQLFMPSVEAEISFQSTTPENTKWYMKAFDLEDLASRHPQSLSEGQKRRVTMGAVTAGNPKVLFMDEPTVGQDYKNLECMVNAVSKSYNEHGMTMFTITHDFRCAQALADKALWIKDGKIYRQGGKELIREYFLGTIR